MPFATAPIGVYDSGLGGLSVVRQLQLQLPHESLIYIADNARVPYGGRSREEIYSFSREIISQLAGSGVKAILCACNTSSVVILPELRRVSGIPVLGLAQAGSRLPRGFRRVALLATEATVASHLYRDLIGRHFPEVELREIACPEFVPLVEQGLWDGDEVEAVLRQRLAPMLAWQPEAVILGCSHYPYLSEALRRVLGPQATLLDPATELVGLLRAKLERAQLRTPYRQPVWKLCTTAPGEAFGRLASRYLGLELPTPACIQLPAVQAAAPAEPARAFVAPPVRQAIPSLAL